MMSLAESRAELLAVETKLAKDPENEEFLLLKKDILEYIQELEELGGDEEEIEDQARTSFAGGTSEKSITDQTKPDRASSSKPNDSRAKSESDNLVDKNSRRTLTEAEILLKKKEKNRKKKAKLRERIKEQLDIAESEKQSWQSFANKRGLKGVTKKSIFASPCSVTGKVGVGTNGIADAPSAAITGVTKQRKH